MIPESYEDFEGPCIYKNHTLTLTTKYADDISEITTSDEAFNETKNKLPKILTNRELKVNISKTEEYKIEEKEVSHGSNANS